MKYHPLAEKLADLSSTFYVHQKENNIFSQLHLDSMRDKFSKDCFEVLKALMYRERLTVKQAMLTGLSNSLPRRLGDLRKFGITHQAEWIYINEKRSHVEYYFSDKDIINASRVLVNKMRVSEEFNKGRE